MSRRVGLLACLLLFGLSGCVTMNDGYYREGYYNDGAYYYPSEDGYGDYYQGSERVDYSYYHGYSYSPFWSLDRYACGPYHRCSPYWNSYYGRPNSGWSLSFGNQWSYGNWGWYGRGWSPWYDNHDYWRHSRPDNGQRPPQDPGYTRPPRQDYTGRPRPGLREPGVIDDDGGEGRRPSPRVENGSDRGRWTSGEGYVRPLPSGDFRERRKAQPIDPGIAPGSVQQPSDARDPGPDYRGYGESSRPQPRPTPRYQRPVPREMPRYESRESGEASRYDRPEPRERPRVERSEPREVRSSSQNESTEREE